jgi:hypothetical protein
MSELKDGEKVLKLDRSRTERAFEERESLWDDHELERMLNLIEKHTTALEKHKRDGQNSINTEELPLLSIGIFGSPGSGKSSLLKTFVHRIRNNGGRYPKIHSFPVIKPNIKSKEDHFLYAFLAAALKEDREVNKIEGQDNRYGDTPILSPLQQKFQEVSEYLQVLNEVEPTQEDDPLGKSLEFLERHESGLMLVEKMKDFIGEFVRIMSGNRNDSSVVLLPVDDADMDMDILISALNTCWRYLRHPQLVPVFTFTGRLAEELISIDFERKLTLEGRMDYSERLMEAATSLMITENMAIQFLSRLFPVRNRIRLGPASARVLGAKFVAAGKNRKYDIMELVKRVSQLLFGYTSPFVPNIKAPLRLVTLRRQLQIVDAMQESGIDELVKDNIKRTDRFSKTWGQYYDLATWTLLNTHRDILKEINMNLDDLYGWTPMGLRLVVRDSILSMELGKRRKILTKLRYRTEGRRSQMLSLLAANVFRPIMEGEEPTGDNLIAIKRLAGKKTRKKNENGYRLSFPLIKGVIWFLDLTIGFYLPQVMGCNYYENISEDIREEEKVTKNKKIVDSITGIGWDFRSGPVHAVREALNSGDLYFSGMMFVDIAVINDIYKATKSTGRDTADIGFFALLCCNYGYNRGRPWAVVSLWRALGLIGQLLRYADKNENIDENNIIQILMNHVQNAKVIGKPPKRRVNETTDITKFETVELNREFLQTRAESIAKWLNTIKYSESIDDGDREIHPLGKQWETCFIRRLHGECLLSDLWRNLENVYFNIQVPEEGRASDGNDSKGLQTVLEVMKGWGEALGNYWAGTDIDKNEDVYRVREILIENPVFTELMQAELL